MPQPGSSSVRPFDLGLTTLSIASIQSQDEFVATKIFPLIPVTLVSAKYVTYDMNPWYRSEVKARGNSQQSAGSGYDMSKDSYSCNRYALHKDVDITIRAQQMAPIDLDRDATAFLGNQFLLFHEIKWQTAFFTTGVWTTDWTGVAGIPGASQVRQWSDFANSTPILDIDAAKRTIKILTGFFPNTLVVGWDVWIKLKEHPDVVAKYKFTQTAIMTEQLVAKALGVDNLYVASAVQATNKEGDTAAYGFIMGKAALLCWVPARPGLLTPSAGYTFAWTGNPGAGNLILGVGVTRFWMQEITSDRFEGESWFDMKKTGADYGLFINNAVG